eukprot:6187037-Pleurochrysis_carterae.AAC.1
MHLWAQACACVVCAYDLQSRLASSSKDAFKRCGKSSRLGGERREHLAQSSPPAHGIAPRRSHSS